ncbi:MAG: LysM peptidoglycan-binding domain-containing protein [Planctomycetota bacterium]
MGKVEKWVVLGVLALIVGILVVSLTVDDPLKRDNVVIDGGAGGGKLLPRTSDAKDLASQPPAESGRAEFGQAPGESKPSALMNASLRTETVEEAAAVPPKAIPAGSILKTMDGLEESYMADTRFYVWKSGDNFPALAQRFYGDVARLGTLRRANEGKNDAQPGDRVLIPVFDPDVPANVATAAPKSQAGESTAKPAAAATEVSGSKVHVVKEGESLWLISKKELGAGSRWKEIYDANRDQLSSPEALKAGLKLRLP